VLQESVESALATAEHNAASAAADVSSARLEAAALRRDIAAAKAAAAAAESDRDAEVAVAAELRADLAALQRVQRELRGQLERARGAAALARHRAGTHAASASSGLGSGNAAKVAHIASAAAVPVVLHLRQRKGVRLAWAQRRHGQACSSGQEAPVVERLLEQIRQGSKHLEELSKVSNKPTGPSWAAAT
jgi:hypothetical protein